MEDWVKSDNHFIPFNRPFTLGTECAHIQDAISSGRLSGDGVFTRRCHNWIEQHTGCGKALLTQSCTAALEMAAMLASTQPGDEIVMPSFTFVSTAIRKLPLHVQLLGIHLGLRLSQRLKPAVILRGGCYAAQRECVGNSSHACAVLP